MKYGDWHAKLSATGYFEAPFVITTDMHGVSARFIVDAVDAAGAAVTTTITGYYNAWHDFRIIHNVSRLFSLDFSLSLFFLDTHTQ